MLIQSLNRCGYDRIAARWDAVRTALSAPERAYLGLVLQGLQHGASVLDLGCGTGRPIAEHLLAARCAVTGVDQSSGMLRLAKMRFPQARWIEASLEAFVPEPGYRAAVAWDSLFHLPRETHDGIFRRVSNVLPAGAPFLLTVGGSAHPAFIDAMFGTSFFYDSHAPEMALSLLQQTGFAVQRAEYLDRPTFGRDKGRFVILARAA